MIHVSLMRLVPNKTSAMIFTIEVNNQVIKARKGDTILETLEQNGIRVPTLCHINGHSPTGACRICVVEVEGRQELIPACSHPVEEWMKIKTHSPRVIKARKTIVELLLSNHPDDCLYCERNGNCELQDLSVDMNVRERRFSGRKQAHKRDTGSPSIVRDPAKCILCGRCVRICEEVEAVSAIDFIKRGSSMVIGTTYNKGLNSRSCHHCGQCIIICPTGALYEKSRTIDLMEGLHNHQKFMVAALSPTVPVSLGDSFGHRSGKDVNGIVTASLRKMGFDKVFDVSFFTDVAIMELATEMVNRLNEGKRLPMFSSCCPSWVYYAETFHPGLIPHLSTTKSPQQIMGTVVKKYYSEVIHKDPKDICCVSVMPCTAKKFEAQRQEMTVAAITHVDHVLTTRELAGFIKLHGIDMQNVGSDLSDEPFQIRSSASKLVGVSGGVAEALARTVYFMITGAELAELKISDLRQNTSRKEFFIQAGRFKLGFAAVSGMNNALKLIDEVKGGRRDLHFIEVMACPGGCVNGGGQPLGSDEKDLKLRVKSLYDIDERETIRVAHKNPGIRDLYQKFLEKPMSDLSIENLHTVYIHKDQ